MYDRCNPLFSSSQICNTNSISRIDLVPIILDSVFRNLLAAAAMWFFSGHQLHHSPFLFILFPYHLSRIRSHQSYFTYISHTNFRVVCQTRDSLSRKKRIISIFLKPLNLLRFQNLAFFLLFEGSFRCRYLLKQIITSIWTDTQATRQNTGNKERPGSWTDSPRTVQRLIEEGQCRSERDKWEAWQGSNISPCRNYSFSNGQPFVVTK